MLLLALGGACGRTEPGIAVVTFPASAVGAEAEVLATQLDRFMAGHPGIRVVTRRTPDAADQRHQLYVQWLNARADDPDVLQLDVIWTPEFAAAGWILPLNSRGASGDGFFPGTIRANRWRGRLYALPWFVDTGMLYWRTDLIDHAPRTPDELLSLARRVMHDGGVRDGFVWQGARYEGLVCVFVEVLGAFGGSILDDRGRVVVDSDAAVRALTWLRDLVADGVSPQTVLAWKEEQTRFDFQNGDALLLRNWPYAYPLMNDVAKSAIAGKFAIAPMPAAPRGFPTATLGGSQLAINANSDVPDAAFEVVRYLTAPAQMLERAEVTGQFPPRPALYDDPHLAKALPAPVKDLRRIIEGATPRPVTPVYTELSELLQIGLHRALTGQREPGPALADAAAEIRALLRRVGLFPEDGDE